jgi:hypothetical protein
MMTYFIGLEQLLLRKPEHQARYDEQRRRIQELIDKASELQVALPGTEFRSEAQARKLRKLADQLERRQAPRPPSHNPMPTRLPEPRDLDLFGTMDWYEREWERALAEWHDVHSSPDALRWFAEQCDERGLKLRDEKARAQQEKERREREWREEYQRREEILRQHRDPVASAFDTLGLPSDADASQIQAQYRHLLERLHPDTNANDASTVSLLRKVTEAMDTLRSTGRV